MPRLAAVVVLPTPPLSLLYPLNQTDPFFAIQFRQQLYRFFMPALQKLLNFAQYEININSASIIHPTVFDRQAHSVKHQAIQQFCIRRDAPEPWIADQLLRNTIKGILLSFMPIEVRQL